MDYNELQKIQNIMSRKLTEEAEFDKKLTMMKIIQGMVTAKNNKIHVEQIIIESENEGIEESEAYNLLEQIKKEGIIEMKDGFIRMR